MNEGDVRHDIYKMLQTYLYWPIHGKDATICPRCHIPIVDYEQGRPDLIVLSPTGRTSVIEVKAVNMNTGHTLLMSKISDPQRKWLGNWKAAGGFGYLAVGTVGTMKREIWVVDWPGWLMLEERAIQAGKKSISIERLQSDMKQYALEKITGGWKLPVAHTLSINSEAFK